MKSCVLLLGEKENWSALETAKKFFEIKAISHVCRWDKDIEPHAKKEILMGVDYVFNFLSPVVLTKDFLQGTCINFHPGPPEYPGVGGASYALFNEENFYGSTAHLMEPKVDSGKILKVKRFLIEKGDTCETLFSKAVQTSLELFEEVLKAVFFNEKLESSETWKGKAVTRKEFEAWMDVTEDDEETLSKKLKALKHSKFPGPYFVIGGEKFWRTP